jgi:hypothetical protein
VRGLSAIAGKNVVKLTELRDASDNFARRFLHPGCIPALSPLTAIPFSSLGIARHLPRANLAQISFCQQEMLSQATASEWR